MTSLKHKDKNSNALIMCSRKVFLNIDQGGLYCNDHFCFNTGHFHWVVLLFTCSNGGQSGLCCCETLAAVPVFFREHWWCAVKCESSNIHFRNKELYLGLTDNNPKKTFAWRDGSAMDYTNWAPNQPSNGGHKDCVSFSPNGQWYDMYCQWYYARYAACKKPLTSGTYFTTWYLKR